MEKTETENKIIIPGKTEVKESDTPLIIIPDEYMNAEDRKKRRKLTMARIVNPRIVADSANKALHKKTLYCKYETALIDTPLGYIMVDHKGGHRKMAFEKDASVIILVYDCLKGDIPIAECPAKISELLKLTDRTMPIAEFVSNQDGNEKNWYELVATMVFAGLETRDDEDYRDELNNGDYILGGAHVTNKKKLDKTIIEEDR